LLTLHIHFIVYEILKELAMSTSNSSPNRKVYTQTIDAVTNSIKIFKFHENVKIYTDIVKSFHKLCKVKKGKNGDLSNMFMNDLEECQSIHICILQNRIEKSFHFY
jgi:hypothetical protein